MRGVIRSGRARIVRAAIVVAVTLVSAAGTLIVATPASAASSSTASLKQLKHALAQAASASSHHHVLPAKAYQQIGKLAQGLEHSLSSPSSGCQAGLAAATRLAGDRHHPARLRSDVKHARTGVANCSAASPPYSPPPPPAPTDVGGVVLNSAGQALANLPITVDVDDPLSFYGKEWTTTTDSTGHFTLPYLISEDQSWYSWTASTQFPWFGGTWPRDLSRVSDSDPANIVFQSSLSQGAQLAISDDTGCDVFWHNPAYPGSNADTKSVTFTLTPVGALIDGSSGNAATLTIPQGQLCDGSVNVPPGAWTVSGGVDNLGRALVFSTDDGNTYASSVEVFNAPQDSAWPNAKVETAFAPPVPVK